LTAVNVTLTVLSRDATVMQYVRDFAKGLGCAVDGGGESGDGGIRIELADTAELVELLDYVALTAIRAGVDVQEPLCRLTYRRDGSAQVTLGVRCVELTLR
jgi:hypothetical protein